MVPLTSRSRTRPDSRFTSLSQAEVFFPEPACPRRGPHRLLPERQRRPCHRRAVVPHPREPRREGRPRLHRPGRDRGAGLHRRRLGEGVDRSAKSNSIGGSPTAGRGWSPTSSGRSAATASIHLLPLAGIPFFGGFFSKFVLFSSAVYATPYSGWMLWLAVSGVLNCALSLYSYARVIRFMGIEEEKTAKLPVPMLLSSRSPSLESSRPGSSPGPSSSPRRRRGRRSYRGESQGFGGSGGDDDRRSAKCVVFHKRNRYVHVRIVLISDPRFGRWDPNAPPEAPAPPA